MTQFLSCALVACGLYFCNAYWMSFYPAYSDCCGQLKQYKYSLCYGNACYYHRNYWIYHPTNYENTGLCKRINHMYYNMKYFTLPNPLPGYCTCRAEATACFLAPTTAEPYVSPGPETAEPTASPGPETEEPTASSGPETEEPTASPGPETEEPTASPGPETEEPTTSSGTETGEPTASPGPETEEPTVSPGPETEEPTASPGPETEEPTASPGPETEEPTASPGPETEEPTASPGPEEPTASPGPETEEPTTSPAPKTEEPTASPGPETEEPTASPGPETEEPPTSPGPGTEEPTPIIDPDPSEPTASPGPETEEPTTSPGPGTDKPSASPGPETEEPTASPGPETEEPTASPGPGTEEPTAEMTTVEVPTTTAQPATTAPSVCPTPPADFLGRVLGGTSIDECTLSAVLTFWVDYKQTCNGVLGYDPFSELKVVILTEFCVLYLQYAMAVEEALTFGFYKGADFPVTLQTEFTILPNHLAIMAPPGTLSQAACTPAAACLYDPATMSDIIDFGSCYISSYGSNLIVGEMPVSTGSLNRADVTRQATCSTRPTTEDEATEPECFVAVNPYVRNCWGDNGAPVFCHLIGSGEEVLYGLVDVIRAENAMNSENMCATSEFHVIPIS